MMLFLNEKKYSFMTALFLFSFFLFPTLAHATAAASLNPIDATFSNFQDAIINGTKFQNALQNFAETLFFGLIVLSMLWRFFPMVLKGATMEEFISEISMYIISTGFFLWLLKNGFEIGMSIIKSLEKLAGLAVGSESIKPTSILSIGVNIFSTLTDKALSLSMLTAPLDVLLYTIVGFGFLLILTLVSITMLLAFIKAYMVIYAGMIVLGFGSATWSQEMVINYFKSALNYGTRIFTLIIVVSICTNVLNGYINRLDVIDINVLAQLLILGLITYMMSNKLPEVVSGMIGATFSSHSNFGNMAQTVATPIQTAAKVAKATTPQGAAALAAEKIAQGAQGSISGGSNNPPPSTPSNTPPPKP